MKIVLVPNIKIFNYTLFVHASIQIDLSEEKVNSHVTDKKHDIKKETKVKWKLCRVPLEN